MRRAATARQCRKRAVIAVDRHVAHAAAGLGSGSGRDHLVVAKERAVEENDVGAGNPFRHAPGVTAAAPGMKLMRALPADSSTPDIRAGLDRGLRILPFEIERHLAGHGEEFGLQAARERHRSAGNNRLTLHHVGRERAEHGIVGEGGERGGGRANRERLTLPQAQQAGDLIDLGAGEDHGFDRASTRSHARMQRLGSPKLLREVGRGVDQDPVFAVRRDREACLGARPNAYVTRPCQPACRATTVPLRKTSPRRRAEHDGGEAPHSGPTRMRRGSELGREVTVDLEADADFDEGGSGPGHGVLP